MDTTQSHEKLTQDFKALREQCIVLRRNYNTYNDLFFSENTYVLEKAALSFFNDIAEIMHRDWILQACKLMDPAKTKKDRKTLENISFKLINNQLNQHGLMTTTIENLSKSLFKYGNMILPARNKRLAHTDREHEIRKIILGETTPEELDKFLENIQQYCDEVGRLIGVGPLDFSSSCCPGDALDLIRKLKGSNNI